MFWSWNNLTASLISDACCPISNRPPKELPADIQFLYIIELFYILPEYGKFGELLLHKNKLRIHRTAQRLSKRIMHPRSHASALDHAGILKISQMPWYFRLTFIKDWHQFTHTELTMSKKHHDSQSHLFGKGFIHAGKLFHNFILFICISAYAYINRPESATMSRSTQFACNSMYQFCLCFPKKNRPKRFAYPQTKPADHHLFRPWSHAPVDRKHKLSIFPKLLLFLRGLSFFFTLLH